MALVAADAAHVDHPVDAGRRRQLPEPASVGPVELREILGRQRVDQVVGHVDILTEPLQRDRIAEVAFEDLDIVRESRLARAPGEGGDVVADRAQRLDELAADEPGRSNNEDTYS